MLIDQLGIVLVWGHHKNLVLTSRHLGQGPNKIIGFIAIQFDYGNAKSGYNFFAIRNGNADFFGLFFSIGLIFSISDVSERGGVGVKCHPNM